MIARLVPAHLPYAIGRLFQRLGRWNAAAYAYRIALGGGRGRTGWMIRHGTVLYRSGRWSEAAQRYASVLAREPNHPRLWARLATARRKLGDDAGAARALDHAVLLRPRRRGWQVTRAKAFEKIGDWHAVVDASTAALALDASRHADHYRLGQALERLGCHDRAAEAYRAGLEVDPTRRPIDDFMLDGTAKKFAARRRVSHWVEDNIVAIQGAVRAHPHREPQGPRRIFVYWAQGFDSAPPVVQMCRDQLMALHGTDVVVSLDDTTIADWVDLTPDVVRRASTFLTQYSDLIRVALLARHGGIWLDATVFVTQRVDDSVDALANGGFFTFRYRPARIASWLMAATPGNYVVSAMLEAQLRYWREHDRVLSYFMFHDTFEALWFLDDEFRRIVEDAPFIRPDWSLAHRIGAPYDPDELSNLLGRTFAHKLTYKQPDAMNRGTILRHLRDAVARRA